MEITRVFDILDLHKTQYQKNDILSAKENKQWKKYSCTDLVNYSNYVSAGLLAMGLTDKDKIGILSNNRPEWNFCDFGAQQANIVTVPVYPTISNDDLKYIINHAEVTLLFISDKNILAKLTQLEKEIPTVKHIVSFNKIENVMHFSDFIELGKKAYNEVQINTIKQDRKSVV